METVQARLGQCLYLLSSSRANECWYAYGTALQLVTALGLHRKCPAKVSKNGNTYLERELRKRIFWSAYTLDKYLSVMFGRPRLLQDEDTDQEFPHEVNDEDILEEDPLRRSGSADCMLIASVLHYRFVVSLAFSYNPSSDPYIIPSGISMVLIYDTGWAVSWVRSPGSSMRSIPKPETRPLRQRGG